MCIDGFFDFVRAGAIRASTEAGPWAAPMCPALARPTVGGVVSVDPSNRRYQHMSRRLLPLSGAVSFALLALTIAWLVGSTPDTKASGAEVAAFYHAHHIRENVAALVLCIASVLLVVFAAHAWRSEAERSSWRFVFVGGAAVAAAGFLAAAGIHFALSEGVHDGIAPAAAQALNVLDENDYFLFAFGMAAMLVGAAGLLVPRRGLDRVLGWAALALAILTATPIGFVGFIGSGVWLLVASLVLVARERRPVGRVAGRTVAA
jgi:hypothetical protein